MAKVTNLTPAGVDDEGKKVFFGSVSGKELTSTIGFYYEDGTQVPTEKLINNPQASQFAAAGWDVGVGPGVSPAGQRYAEVTAGKTGLSVLGETAPTYGDAVYDPINKIVIVRDENGTSIYNEQGNLISGRGSARQIGVAAGSSGLAKQIDINAVGTYGTPEYNIMAGQGPKQNLAAPGGKLAPGGTTVVTTPTTATTATTANAANMPTGNLTAAQSEAKSAYTLLYEQFQRYGLGSLVEPLKNLIMEGVSPAEFTIRLRETDAYKKRFAANQKRISQGLRALSEAEYIALEDQYQDVMRRYGLPETYYSRGEMGTQAGFEKFIGLDVSPVELEDRIQTAYNRVINANPEVGIALKTFYPGITNGDILAYALDPQEALDKIKRKVTAAEIGGAAVQAGLTTNESDAEYLARYGITKEQAQAGYRTISGYLPRAQQLSSIYGKQVEGGPYTQATAEQEVFGVPGAAEAERKRLKITALEQAAFTGQSGLTGGALGRERAGQF